MFSAFSNGFILGLSLIIAIGAQNAFVLRQGMLKEHIFYVALFCSISDALLICLGVTGISYLMTDYVGKFSNLIFTLAAIWLFGYGILRIRSAYKINSTLRMKHSKSNSLTLTISSVAVLTFLNPHVYLDTMILIGSISQQFIGNNRIAFAAGACLASFVWFFCLSLSAEKLSKFMHKPFAWRVLDSIIAFIMFALAINFFSKGISLR